LSIYNTKIGEFCATHSNWEELLAAEPYSIKVKREDGFVIFNYNQLSSNFNLDIVRECRGIIFHEGEWEVPVCHAFDKFGNYGEEYIPEMDWSTVTVSEKIDGSIMKLWNFAGEWVVSTNGNIFAYKSPIDDIRRDNFEQVFWEGVRKHFGQTIADAYDIEIEDWLKSLDTGYTYIFELVSPFNRVVIPYETTDVYFLGARNNISNNQWGCDEATAKRFHMDMFPRPKLYPMTTYEEIAEAAMNLPWKEEGYVCYDSKFNRCKIKSPSYVVAHFARNNNVITRKHLIDVYLKGEEQEFLIYAEDYRGQMEYVVNLIHGYHRILNNVVDFCKGLRALSRSTYADFAKRCPKIMQEFMFDLYSRDITAEDYTKDWDKYRWDRVLTQYERFLREKDRNDL
jgi:hypothetical protein